MATLFAPLRCVATAVLFALVVSVLARADEKPAVTDETLDAALEKAAAAKVGEAEFRESLRSVAPRFPLVEASTAWLVGSGFSSARARTATTSANRTAVATQRRGAKSVAMGNG